MSGKVTQAAVIEALRGSVPGGKAWTPALVARATGVTQAEVAAAIQSLRYAGKIEFKRLALTASMLEQAERVSGGEVADTPPCPVDSARGDAPLPRAEIESRAKAGDEAGVGMPMAEPVEPVSRPVAGRSATATSEPMDVTAGETAPDQAPAKALTPTLSRAREREDVARQVESEAAAAVDRRRLARRNGGGVGIVLDAPSATVIAVQAALLETPEDGLTFLRRRWPVLLRELVELGRAEGVAPGPMMIRAIEAGLLAIRDNHQEAERA